MKRKKFHWEGNTLANNIKFIDANKCADITFINLGTASVIIGNTFLPGFAVGGAPASFTDPAFGDEVNETKYDVVFGAGTQSVQYRRKIYDGYED